MRVRDLPVGYGITLRDYLVIGLHFAEGAGQVLLGLNTLIVVEIEEIIMVVLDLSAPGVLLSEAMLRALLVFSLEYLLASS